jgi:hypothetical protein
MSLGPGLLHSLLSSRHDGRVQACDKVFRFRHTSQPPELAIWHSCRDTPQHPQLARRKRKKERKEELRLVKI